MRLGAFQVDDVAWLRRQVQEKAGLKKLVVQRDLELGVVKVIAAKNGERAVRRKQVCAMRRGAAARAGLDHQVWSYDLAFRLVRQGAVKKRPGPQVK